MATKDETRDSLILALAEWALADLDIPWRLRLEIQKKMHALKDPDPAPDKA
jgi:hypothetical protein